jgi:hypothetical protein
MPGLHHGLAVERGMHFLDPEAVLPRNLCQRTARRSGHFRPDALPGQAGDDERAPAAHGCHSLRL